MPGLSFTKINLDYSLDTLVLTVTHFIYYLSDSYECWVNKVFNYKKNKTEHLH